MSWLLRQLQGAPESLKVEARVARSQATLAAPLAEARSTPERLYPEASKEIRQFGLTLTRNMGLKRDAGKGSFIDGVLEITKDFYGEVLQNLRPWKPSPPKLQKPSMPEVPESSELPSSLQEPVRVAHQEQAQQRADVQSPGGTSSEED
jgi:hypothetical protein